MAEHKDFYTDALKAFNTPMPQPQQEAPAQTLGITEPDPQEKPKRKFSRWLPVALFAVLCLVPVMCRGGDSGTRGENCAYGVVMEQREDSILFATGDETWCVRLDALDGYDSQRNIEKCLVWFFYNGEPKIALQKDCDRQITATHLVVTSIEHYEDELAFDLDGDGRNELWSIRKTDKTKYDTTGNALYIQAKDRKGNILHQAYMDVDYTFAGILKSDGNKLLVVERNYRGDYENIDIRLENGELAVYRRGQKQQLRQPSQEESYEVSFMLDGNISGRIQLSIAQGTALKKRLDALDWSEPNSRDYVSMGNMNFYTADEQFTYHLGYGDVLIWDSRVARIDTEFYLSLLQLMPWQMPKYSIYNTDLGDFEMVSIHFREDGAASLWGWDPDTGERKSYEGRYATLQGYASIHYYLFLGERFDQVVVVYQDDGTLRYRQSQSNHTMFPVEEVAISFDPA